MPKGRLRLQLQRLGRAAFFARRSKGRTVPMPSPTLQLERRVRPEGQKGAPSLEDVRSPRKTAGPRKRRSAARRIAGGACCTSAGGPKGLKAFGTGRSAGTGGCAHRAGDGTNTRVKPRREAASA